MAMLGKMVSLRLQFLRLKRFPMDPAQRQQDVAYAAVGSTLCRCRVASRSLLTGAHGAGNSGSWPLSGGPLALRATADPGILIHHNGFPGSCLYHLGPANGKRHRESPDVELRMPSSRNKRAAPPSR